MARLYKQPKSSFWFVDYFAADGSRKRVSTKTKSRTVAERILTKLTRFRRIEPNPSPQVAEPAAERVKRTPIGKPSKEDVVEEGSPPVSNLRQLAQIAGISVSAVSRALRNDRNISSATCRRVQKLAADTGYRANPMVSALMSSRVRSRAPAERQVLACLNASTNKTFLSKPSIVMDYVAGAQERAVQYGYKLEEFWLKEPRMTAEKMSDILFHRGIQGILISPIGRRLGHVSLKWDRFATAVLGYSMTQPALHRAVPDHLTGIRLALRQLRKLGYRRIGLALDPWQDIAGNNSWSAGFAEHVLFLPPRNRVHPFYTPFYSRGVDTAAKFNRWVKRERPDALVAGDVTVKIWMQDLGLHAPKDFGFVQLDHPSVDNGNSGIYMNGKNVGAAAIDLIVGQINRNERGLPDAPKRTIISCRWIEGASTKPMKS